MNKFCCMSLCTLSVRMLRLATLLVSLLVITGCASFPDREQWPSSYALSSTEVNQTGLGRLLQPHAASHPGKSGFALLLSGESAFKGRATLADSAQRTLDLQYYSVGDDLATNLLLSRLAQAARHGVRVRVLLDDVHASARQFARRAMAMDSTIQVRLFNPFRTQASAEILRWGEFLFDGPRLNRRMHNKLWLADNAVAIMGSRNLGNEYFNVGTDFNFYDVDLLAAGPIVGELSRVFDTYWNSPLAVPVEALAITPEEVDVPAQRESLRDAMVECSGTDACKWITEELGQSLSMDVVNTLTWAKAQLSYDAPGANKEEVSSGIQHGAHEDMPGGADTLAELLIISPYFIPGERGRSHLRSMRDRGVRVAVLTNSLVSTDSTAAHAGYARHRLDLLRKGVELYEIRPESRRNHHFKHRWETGSQASLHGKVIVQDRARVIVGSLNQDPRSRLYNTEAWILIDSQQLAGELAALFDEGSDPVHAFRLEAKERDGSSALSWVTEEGGKELHFDEDPQSSPVRRFWRDILGVLVPESLL